MILFCLHVLGLCFFGCAPSEDTGDQDDTSLYGEDETIVVFESEYVHFGDENRRTVDIEVIFPDEGLTYSAITGRFVLSCPNGLCDHWDRYATFGVVFDAGEETETYMEIDRFITPYRVGMQWESDLTDLRPTLTGPQTLRVFIDTWVTEGHSNGDGWLFDAEFEFVGGEPSGPAPIANVPVWGHLSWQAGLPDNPVENQVVPQSIALPPHTAATFRSFISGHGWDNSQNCAEFCPKDHHYSVGGEEFGREVWRDDCSETETDGTQMGTWQYSRAGWCPGAQVYPWDTDVSDQTVGSDAVEVSYRLEDFVWAGDGDQPYYYMSGVVLVYE